MLQPSFLTSYIFSSVIFLVFIGIFFVISLWGLKKSISHIQKLPEFTDFEVTVIRHQMLVLLGGITLFLLFFALSPLVWGEVKRWPPYASILALIIGFLPLVYISVNSIKNRVSMFRGIDSSPTKGAKAIWYSILNLVLTLLAFGYALYYFFPK